MYKHVYHHTCNASSWPPIEALRGALPKALDIVLKWRCQDRQCRTVHFAYQSPIIRVVRGDVGYDDEEEPRFKVRPEPPYAVEEFYARFRKEANITVVAEERMPIGHVERFEYEDYPGMITDLERKGVVTTFTTESVMATDPRRFRYKDGEYDVDCLGTALCRQISHDIEEEWRRIDSPISSE